MKIAYVITKGTWGGAQSHVFSLIKDQVARKNDVELIVGQCGRLVDDVIKNFPQVNVYPIETLTNNLRPDKVLVTISKIRKILKQSKPDIVHLHSTVAGTLGRIASIGLNLRVVFTVHGSSFTPGVDRKRERFARIVERILVPFTDRIIFVSKFDQNLWNTQLKGFKKSDKGIVIYNGVEDKGYFPKVRNTDILELCMAARFSSPKNQELLINTIKNSSFSNQVHVTFLGDGKLLKECKKVAGSNNSTFSFVGAVEDVSKYYENADIVMLISNFEGLPISLIEALPLGKPIIASNVGGIPEIVSADNGFCVDNIQEAIKRCLEKVISNPKLLEKMGENSRMLYEKDFEIQKMVSKTNNVYKELMG